MKKSSLGLKSDGYILPDGQISYDSFLLSVLRAKGYIILDGIKRISYILFLALYKGLSFSFLICAKDEPCKLASSGT